MDCRTHFHRIVLDDTHVGESELGNAFQQAAHPGRVHFDTEVVVLGVVGGDTRSRISHAETDLQDPGRYAPEHRVEIQRCRRVRDSKSRRQLGMRAPLRRGEAPLAQDIASDRPHEAVGGER